MPRIKVKTPVPKTVTGVSSFVKNFSALSARTEQTNGLFRIEIFLKFRSALYRTRKRHFVGILYIASHRYALRGTGNANAERL